MFALKKTKIVSPQSTYQKTAYICALKAGNAGPEWACRHGNAQRAPQGATEGREPAEMSGGGRLRGHSACRIVKVTTEFSPIFFVREKNRRLILFL